MLQSIANALHPSKCPELRAGQQAVICRGDGQKRADMRRAERGALAYKAGLAAEDAALRHYQREGAALLCRRRRRAGGEIDLILREENCLVFVEVKRRKTPIHEDPVSPAQWQRLEAAAEQYMLEAGTGDIPLRFDLALVDRMGTVEVIKNARM